VIKQRLSKDLNGINNFIVNESITRTQIINIETIYERGNPDWGVKAYRMFYFEPSVLGDDQ